VWALRARGVEAYATMDAGPHVKVLVRPSDADRVKAFMTDVPGVLRVLTTRPGEGARVVEEAE
jgi:diphosphomevalonate decarboxylase